MSQSQRWRQRKRQKPLLIPKPQKSGRKGESQRNRSKTGDMRVDVRTTEPRPSIPSAPATEVAEQAGHTAADEVIGDLTSEGIQTTAQRFLTGAAAHIVHPGLAVVNMVSKVYDLIQKPRRSAAKAIQRRDDYYRQTPPHK